MNAAPPAKLDYLALPLRVRLRWVLVLGSLTAFFALTLDLYLPSLPQLRSDLGTSDQGAQLTLTATLGGLAVGHLVVGPLSDALGRRLPLLIGLGLHVLASVGAAVAPSVGVLLVMRVLHGLGAAATLVTALAVTSDLFSAPGASRLIGRLVLVIGVSPVLAPTLGAQLLHVTNWRGIFVVLAVAGVLLALLVGLRLPETLPVSQRPTISVRGTMSIYRRLLSDSGTAGLVLTGGFVQSVIFSFVAGAPLVLQERYGLSVQQFGLAFAAVAACLTIGTQVAAQLAIRISQQRLVVLGVSGALVASGALAVDVIVDRGGAWTVTGFLCVATAFLGLGVPGPTALTMNRSTWAAGSAAALLGCTQFSIGASVLPLVTIIGLRSDIAMAVAMTTGCALAIALTSVVVLPVLRRERLGR